MSYMFIDIIKVFIL